MGGIGDSGLADGGDGLGDPSLGDVGLGDGAAGDLGFGDLGLGDAGSADGGDGTTISAEADTTGEAPWSSIVSERRADGSLAQQLVFNRDGSVIHSEYAAPSDTLGWDERHSVVTPDGDRIRFERSGDTVTTTDANSGEVLGRATWGPGGPEPDATVQPAFVGPAAPATIEAATALYTWLSGRNSSESTAVLCRSKPTSTRRGRRQRPSPNGSAHAPATRSTRLAPGTRRSRHGPTTQQIGRSGRETI